MRHPSVKVDGMTPDDHTGTMSPEPAMTAMKDFAVVLLGAALSGQSLSADLASSIPGDPTRPDNPSPAPAASRERLAWLREMESWSMRMSQRAAV
jgi:hypothetical protein